MLASRLFQTPSALAHFTRKTYSPGARLVKVTVCLEPMIDQPWSKFSILYAYWICSGLEKLRAANGTDDPVLVGEDDFLRAGDRFSQRRVGGVDSDPLVVDQESVTTMAGRTGSRRSPREEGVVPMDSAEEHLPPAAFEIGAAVEFVALEPVMDVVGPAGKRLELKTHKPWFVLSQRFPASSARIP